MIYLISIVMKKVKITVLRVTFNEDFAQEYGMPGLQPCQVMQPGQVFYAGLGKPDGFCDGAWRSIHQYVFALAIAFLLSTMYVKFRDIGHIWDVIMQIWFYVTPIIYPLSQLITGMGIPVIAKLMLILNPMAQIIQDARYVLVTTQTETIWNIANWDPANTWPAVVKLIPMVMTIGLFITGVVIFRKNSKTFAEEL